MKPRTAKAAPRKPLAAAPETNRSVLWTIIVLGFVLRLVIAAFSIGSNDAAAFFGFAAHVYFRGLFTAYQENIDLNHPPIPAYFSAGVLWFCQTVGLDPLTWFFFVFKLPGILADAVSAWLIYRIWTKRAGSSRGLAAAAVYSISVAAILVSGYHGNTDTIYACLSLLAVYLLQDKRRPLLGGLALAGAINIKLIPCLLIPVLLLSLRKRREVIGFLGGLAVGVIPFLPPLLVIGPAFYTNAIAYTPGANRWGILLPFIWWRPYTFKLEPHEGFAYYYNAYGRYLILALVTGWAIVAAKLRRWSRYEAAAVVYTIFLIFAPGFGVQYTVIVIPLMMATSLGRRRLGLIYSLASGLFLLAAYWVNWDGNYPFGSDFRNYLAHEAAIIGLLAWGTLVWFLVQLLRSPSGADEDGDPLPTEANAAASAPMTR